MESQQGEIMDQSSFRSILEQMATQANHGCGQVYELYARRFSSMVDAHLGMLNSADAAVFVELATTEFDYCTLEQRDEQRRVEAKMGLCSHGLDEQTCPCGCFEN